MTHIARIILLAVLLFFAGCQSISVMTYNVRINVAVDGGKAWPHRKDLLVAQIRKASPDIFGVQEALPAQIEDMRAGLPDYAVSGHGREGGNKGEYSAIFYDRAKFSVEQAQTFWLSNTPEKQSMGWDAAYLRVCSYGLFTHLKNGKKTWVFNTHLDNEGEQARANGLKLILEKIRNVNTENHPVVLMGDFNAEPDTQLINNLKQQMLDAKDIARRITDGPEGTYNAFAPVTPSMPRIDYVMLSKSPGIKVKDYAVLYDENLAQYPSDHFPVIVSLSLK